MTLPLQIDRARGETFTADETDHREEEEASDDADIREQRTTFQRMRAGMYHLVAKAPPTPASATRR